MSVKNYLLQKADEPWTPEERESYIMAVPRILEEFYSRARRGLAPGIPTFETRFPDGRIDALVRGLGVDVFSIGADYESIVCFDNKAKLLEDLERRALGLHRRRVVNLTGYGKHDREGEPRGKEFTKTQQRNVRELWENGK